MTEMKQADPLPAATILFSLWAVQGVISLAWLALLPTDTQQGLLFGFSSSRLILMGAAFALAAFSASLVWFSRRTDFMLRPAQSDILTLLSVIVTLLAPVTIMILRALGQTSGFVYTAYADRLAPLAFWFALSALEFALWRIWADRTEISATLKPAKPFFLLASYFLFALTALTIFILITRLGLTPYNDGSWGSPTTPLLEWQILLALVIGLLFIVLAPRF